MSSLLDAIIAKLDKISGPDQQGWYTTLCPFHNDQHKPNLRFRETGFLCMACGQKGSLKALAEKLGLPIPQAEFGLTIKQLADAKGIPEEFLRSLGVTEGFSGSWKQRYPCVDIPYMDEAGQVIAIQKRLSMSGQPRFIWRRGDHPMPYGLWRLKEANSQGKLVIVEGASDCWTLWLHDIPAIGLPGASTWKPQYARFTERLTAYVWVEPDSGGNTFLKDISSSLQDIMVIEAPEGVKDPSELYLQDKEVFTEAFNGLLSKAKPTSEISNSAKSEEASKLSVSIRPLAEDACLIDRLKEAVVTRGYAGDPRPALIAYVAITSRLLTRPLNIIFVAQSGSGKNASIENVLPFFPDAAYYIVRASSPLALVYSDESFSHKTIVLWEADSLPEEGPAASAIRSLMSDQRLEYQVVEKDDSGHQTVRVIKKEGPTGLITTSTKPLREQASTRMLTVSIPDTPEQTRAVLQAIARKESEPTGNHGMEQWIDFQRWLEIAGRREVSVPFAHLLADKVNSDSVRIRRDFSQVLTVIKVFALMHQMQRGIDDHGRIIATLDDYRLARWLLEEVFSTSSTGGLTPSVRETVEAVGSLYLPDSPVSLHQLVESLKLSKSSVSYRVARAVEGGWLVNRASQRGMPARLEPGIPMPDKTLLPDLEQLMVCVKTPQNHSNTRTLPQNEANLASKVGQEVFESAFEHPFEHLPENRPFEHSFEHPQTASFEAKTTSLEGTVRVFEAKSGGLTHTTHQTRTSAEEAQDSLLEEWRRISIPEWRRILQQSIEAKDAKREEYARWMLKEILEDPDYKESAL